MTIILNAVAASTYEDTLTFGSTAAATMILPIGTTGEGHDAALTAIAQNLLLSVNSWGSQTSIKCIIYDEDDSSALVESVIIPSSVGTGLISVPLSGTTTLISGRTYRLAIYTEDADSVVFDAKTSGNGGTMYDFRTFSGSYASPIDPLGAGSWNQSIEVFWAVDDLSGADDTTPDAFEFDDLTDQAVSTLLVSSIETITGIDASTPISVDVGEYRINGGSWVTAAGNLVVNDTVQLRHTSSSSNSTLTSQTLNIGGVTDQWDVTTIAAADLEAVFPNVGVNATGLTYSVFDSFNIATANRIKSGTDAAIVSNVTVIDLNGLASLDDEVLLVMGDFTTSPSGASKAAVCFVTVTEA